MGTNTQKNPVTPEEIWGLLREASKNQTKADRELRRQMAATDRQIKTLSAKTDRQIAHNLKELKKTRDLFTNEWGRLVESLVQGKLLRLLKKKGIQLKRISSNEKGMMSYTDEKGHKREQYCEIDIIAKNGEEVVAVEIKSTLGVKEVNKFLSILRKFTQLLPEYKGKKVYGAVAYLKVNEEADIYAEGEGLFVIRATGDSASIINKENFKPKFFSVSNPFKGFSHHRG